MKDNRHIEYLKRFFEGTASAEEELDLLEWLRDKSEASPELNEYYRDCWLASTGVMDEGVKARIRERIRNSIDRQTKVIRPMSPVRRRFTRLLPWIAAACFAVAAGIGWFNYARMATVRSERFEIYTDKGQKTNVTLPDGTRVWLNSQSKLSYDGGYNLTEREVALEGEGYFEVARDPERRFRASTSAYTVEALGTAFNVKAYPEDRHSVTTLFEGKVRVADEDRFSATLLPMQAIVYDSQTGAFRQNDSDRIRQAGLWRNNELLIESGTTLEKLTELLDREYNIRFEFRSERIKHLHFEGVIKDNNLNNVLQLIGLSGEVCYTVRDNIVILDEKR